MAPITSYQNPIVPGFAPDPSVVLVDGIFFLVNSSFHVFPGLPLYASTDLKEWTLIGNAINRTDQLSLNRASTDAIPLPHVLIVAAGGLFAPTIRHRHGVFYIVCTNTYGEGDRLNTKNFIISTADIWSNKWSDPIYFDFDGIDPSLFFDDDGRVYVQGSWHAGPIYNPMCTIRQFEIDLRSGKALSETKIIWKGFLSQGDVEGPHLYKKDGNYFLMAAEGGTWEHHLLSISRSTSDIWGPYETYGANPILTADGKDEYIQNTGHGELFQDGQGNWWAAVLGIRRGDQGRSPLGRESFLAPVTWPEGGWPKVQQPKTDFNHLSISPAHNESALRQRIAQNAVLDGEYLYLRNPHASDYTISGREISLTARNTSLSAPTGTTTFLGRRQRSLDATASVTLQLRQLGATSSTQHRFQSNEDLIAGMTLFKDDLRHVDLYYKFSSRTVCLDHTHNVKRPEEPQSTTSHGVNVELSPACHTLDFKIQANPNTYNFLYRAHGETEKEPNWTVVGTVDSLLMTANDFTGTILGVFASTTATSSTVTDTDLTDSGQHDAHPTAHFRNFRTA